MLFNSADRSFQRSAHQWENQRDARTPIRWRDYLEKEVNHVRLGCNIFNNRHNSSGLGIWRDRRSVGGNRQVSVLSVPGDVSYLCDFRMARQRSSLISGTVCCTT